MKKYKKGAKHRSRGNTHEHSINSNDQNRHAYVPDKSANHTAVDFRKALLLGSELPCVASSSSSSSSLPFLCCRFSQTPFFPSFIIIIIITIVIIINFCTNFLQNLILAVTIQHQTQDYIDSITCKMEKK